jgi:hypothetical protein
MQLRRHCGRHVTSIRKVRGAVLFLSQAVREICDFVEANHGHIEHDTMAGRIAELHALLRCNLPSPSKCSKQLHAHCVALTVNVVKLP